MTSVLEEQPETTAAATSKGTAVLIELSDHSMKEGTYQGLTSAGMKLEVYGDCEEIPWEKITRFSRL